MSTSLQRVTLILLDLTQNNVFVCFRLRYAVFSIMFLRKGFPLFSYLNFAFNPQKESKNMFWFVGNEIESSELYVRKSSNLVFPRKARYFKLHNTENMFWLVGTKLAPKRFCLFQARLRCFQQYVSEDRLFLSSLPKLRF